MKIKKILKIIYIIIFIYICLFTINLFKKHIFSENFQKKIINIIKKILISTKKYIQTIQK